MPYGTVGPLRPVRQPVTTCSCAFTLVELPYAFIVQCRFTLIALHTSHLTPHTHTLPTPSYPSAGTGSSTHVKIRQATCMAEPCIIIGCMSAALPLGGGSAWPEPPSI